MVERFVDAWERADIDDLVAVLTEDVRFTMPPLPAWFDGRAAVVRFVGERVFATPWRLVRFDANGQPGFACYQGVEAPEGRQRFRLAALNVLDVRGGRIAWIASFLEPDLLASFGLPAEL